MGERTVGERLRARIGAEYDQMWLAQALGCKPEAAAELDGYWIPQGPPHLLEQTLGVFAKVLELDAQRLINLINSVNSAPRSAPAASAAAPAARRSVAPSRPKAAEAPSTAPRRATVAPAPAHAEISIGSADGIRVVKQQQPTIVFRKTRRYVAQS
jgi:hypothetical protein